MKQRLYFVTVAGSAFVDVKLRLISCNEVAADHDEPEIILNALTEQDVPLTVLLSMKKRGEQFRGTFPPSWDDRERANRKTPVSNCYYLVTESDDVPASGGRTIAEQVSQGV